MNQNVFEHSLRPTYYFSCLLLSETGFRASNDWFPETINYTGTPQKIRDYEKETRRLVDESAPVAIALTVAEDVLDRQVDMGGSETSALLALLKQYHDDQMKNHEMQAKQFDEQKETITELRTEIQFCGSVLERVAIKI